MRQVSEGTEALLTSYRQRILLLAMLLIVSAASAAPSCTNWMPQGDGTSVRVCVADNGETYCEQLKGRSITRIKCR